MVGRLLVRSSLLFAIVVVIETMLLLAPANQAVLDDPYLLAWQAKHQRLIGPGSRRLIFVGGSNVAFGIDSATLEAGTGRHTINLGLHGGIGLQFMLNEAARGVRSGDVVVLIPEYEQFYGDLLNGSLETVQVVQYHWSALQYVSSWGQWQNFVRNALAVNSRAVFARIDRLKSRVRGNADVERAEDPIYHSRAFDEYGDVVAHLHENSKPESVAALALPIEGRLNERAFASIARFARTVERRGAMLLVSHPAVTRRYWTINRAQILEVENRLAALGTMSPLHENIFDDERFFDTPYHLNRHGREARTTQLSRLLESAAIRAHSNAPDRP